MLHGSLCTPVVHQPTQTMANKRDYLQKGKGHFAGISERQRTATTLRICLHTAEDAGSIPASPTVKSGVLPAVPHKALVAKKSAATSATGPPLCLSILDRVIANPLSQSSPAKTRGGSRSIVSSDANAQPNEHGTGAPCAGAPARNNLLTARTPTGRTRKHQRPAVRLLHGLMHPRLAPPPEGRGC